MEIIFNLYAKREIKHLYSLDFYNPKEAKGDLKLNIAIGLEFISRIKATIEKIIFTEGEKGEQDGKEVKKVRFEVQLDSEAETGFEGII